MYLPVSDYVSVSAQAHMKGRAPWPSLLCRIGTQDEPLLGLGLSFQWERAIPISQRQTLRQVPNPEEGTAELVLIAKRLSQAIPTGVCVGGLGRGPGPGHRVHNWSQTSVPPSTPAPDPTMPLFPRTTNTTLFRAAASSPWLSPKGCRVAHSQAAHAAWGPETPPALSWPSSRRGPGVSLNKKLSWPQAAYPHPHTGPGFTSLHPVSSHTSVEVRGICRP